MEFFRPSDSHGFLLLYFFLTLILGKCLLYISTKCLWNVSKACCVSVALLISSQLMLLMAWQKLSLFWEPYNLLYIYASFSSISICLAIWKLESGQIYQLWIIPVQNDLYLQYHWWIYCQSMWLMWQSLLRGGWWVVENHYLTSYQQTEQYVHGLHNSKYQCYSPQASNKFCSPSVLHLQCYSSYH